MIVQRTIEIGEFHESSAVLQRFVLLCETRFLLLPFCALERSPLASPFIVSFKEQSSKIQKDGSESCSVRTTCALMASVNKSHLKIKLRSPSHLSAFESILTVCHHHFMWCMGRCSNTVSATLLHCLYRSLSGRKLCWWSSPPVSAGSPQENTAALVFHSADETDLTLN